MWGEMGEARMRTRKVAEVDDLAVVVVRNNDQWFREWFIATRLPREGRSCFAFHFLLHVLEALLELLVVRP
jgi:hypothetical protein